MRARRGGAVVVGVRIGAGGPELAVSTFVATHAADDALAQAPFAAAHDLVHRRRAPRGEAEALVAEGRRRQDAAAVEGLAALAARLDAPLAVALLINRAGWIGDLLGHAIGWVDHVPVVEGLAVREALRFARGGRGFGEATAMAGFGTRGQSWTRLLDQAVARPAKKHTGLPVAPIAWR